MLNNNNNNKRIVHSPLTKSSDVSLISLIDLLKIRDEWRKAFSIDISDEISGYEQMELYQCNTTGLRFFEPLNIAGSKDLYAQLQKADWYYNPWKWEHETAFSSLRKGDKILEVGCGDSGFVRKLLSDGFQVEGIELNSTAVASAKACGLPVSEVHLSEMSIERPGQFDVVCSFQVLEHVVDPAAFITDCLKLLKTGGKLILCVPNNDSFLKYQYNLLDMPPHHMTQWSVSVFRALEKFFPLKLHAAKYEPLATYHVNGYLESYAMHWRMSGNLFGFLLNRITLPIVRIVMMIGFRRICRGQSIYVEFEKLEDQFVHRKNASSDLNTPAK